MHPTFIEQRLRLPYLIVGQVEDILPPRTAKFERVHALSLHHIELLCKIGSDLIPERTQRELMHRHQFHLSLKPSEPQRRGERREETMNETLRISHLVSASLRFK